MCIRDSLNSAAFLRKGDINIFQINNDITHDLRLTP